MEAAKASVKKVLSKSGQHDTTVHERVAPAVQHETVAPKEREHLTTAVDREVHQDHYHTTEQPISHSETLPEQHHHREIPIERREFEHDRKDEVERGLADERAKYKDTSTRINGEHTKTTEPTVVGEHVHHHVHENIQPIVHKHTVEPHVMHTTAPIHEVHHNETQHHNASALPAVSMDEFKKQGGTLKGRGEHKDYFPGEPRSFEGDHAVNGHSGGIGLDGHGQDPNETHNNSIGSASDSVHKKPSLIDRINPKKDADGDGKAGFMK